MRPFVFAILLATPVLAESPRQLLLAPGKFGNALDATRSSAVIAGSERLRTLPLTLECWVKLANANQRNALLAYDVPSSPRHWALATEAKSGALTLTLSAYTPAVIVAPGGICDNQWHYLAATCDGTTVQLFVDAKLVHTKALTPAKERKDVKGGTLTIGVISDGPGQETRCAGLIDDVRITRGVLKIDGVPTAALALEPPTLGLWPFDDADVPSVDPAWTPRATDANAASWEKENDKDWLDTRLRQMDTGPSFNATMQYPFGKGLVRSYKATAVRLGTDAGLMFDRGQLRYVAGWTGGFLQHSDKRFGLLNTPTPAGICGFATASGPGWEPIVGSDSKAPAATTALPAEWGQYRGYYRHGDQTIFSYTVNGVEVLDLPGRTTVAGKSAFTRTVRIAAHERPITLRTGVEHIGYVPPNPAIRPLMADGHTNLLFAPATEARTIRISYNAAADEAVPVTDLEALTKGGPARWQPLTTQGVRGPDNGTFALDTLTIPYDNPYKALFFVGGVDFLPDGRIVICTAHGDVWIVEGANDTLAKLTWRRFATGLYHPVGIKMVAGKIVVLERGQLTRLHDLNNDGEADFYECISNQWHTGAGEHSYDTCLETDPQGNFYFFKTGDTETPSGGCLLRVPATGGPAEVFATGFRHPIGLGMSPTGVLTGADQEGNWMPSTRIDRYQRGGFYGDMRAHHRAQPPTTYDLPLLWLPREADNSAGGQVWVPANHWGPFGGRMIHLSYGRCRALLIAQQQVGDVWQGAGMDLGLFFLSGASRGRFHPTDGHLYVTGLKGWQTAAPRDGCLQRVRYTGQPWRGPLDVTAHAQGVKLTFAQPLDKATAENPAAWHIEQWNYRWSGDYGSKRWSVVDANQPGPDAVTVHGATLADDGKSVFVRTTALVPVMQMQIGYQVRSATGTPMVGTVYNTIHRPAP